MVRAMGITGNPETIFHENGIIGTPIEGWAPFGKKEEGNSPGLPKGIIGSFGGSKGVWGGYSIEEIDGSNTFGVGIEDFDKAALNEKRTGSKKIQERKKKRKEKRKKKK